MSNGSWQGLADADVNSPSVGKITLVRCSAGSAKSVDDVSLDSVPGMSDYNSTKCLHFCLVSVVQNLL